MITTNVLTILQRWFTNKHWLTSDHATIADIAVYPYIALSQEANIDLNLYPSVTAWLSRIQALTGYVGMPCMWQST